MNEKKDVTVAVDDKMQDTSPGLSIDEALRDYLELKKSLREINLKISQTEEQLSSLFESAGTEKVQTYLGILSRNESGSRTIWTIEI